MFTFDGFPISSYNDQIEYQSFYQQSLQRAPRVSMP